MRVAFVGFGEVGYYFARHLSARGLDLTAYRRRRELAEARARDAGVRLCASLAEALDGAEVVLSCAWPQTAVEVAQQAAPLLGPGQVFADMNNVSPGTAQRVSDAVAPSGAGFAKIAIMGAARVGGGRTPLIVGGPAAQQLGALMSSWDMNVQAMVDTVQAAAAFKIVRAYGLKATTAAAFEMLRLARRYGIDEEALLVSAGEMLEWPGYGGRMGAMITGTAVHAGRRAQEMDEVSETMTDVGLDDQFAQSVRRVYEGLAASCLRDLFGETPPSDYKEVLDAVEGRPVG